MTDQELVERLRADAHSLEEQERPGSAELERQAANRIESLLAEIESMWKQVAGG